MKTGTLVVVMAHAGAGATLFRHLPHFEKHEQDIVIFTPEDSVVGTFRHWVWAYGKASHHDAGANRRFKELINMAWLTSYERVYVFEYDALCLSKGLPGFFMRRSDGTKDFDYPIIAGNVFTELRPESETGFKGQTYIHPPIFANRLGLNMLRAQLNMLPEDCELGFWDRMVGLACERVGLKPLDFQTKGLGFARNTIENGDINDAYDAAKSGAIFFHGIKSSRVLEALLHGHQTAKNEGRVKEGLEIPLE